MTTDQVFQVGEVRFNLDDRVLVFNPTDDITGKEVCLILQMVLNIMGQREGKIDIGSFIVKNNLFKHFTEPSDEPKESQETA